MATRSATRVGALLLAALAVMAAGVLLIGDKNNLFRRKDLFYVEFPSVAGLKAGNPVQLDGVDIGTIREIVLSQRAGAKDIRVEIAIDRRYAERLRAPQDGSPVPAGPGTAPMSQARIKTLGLLGDKFIEINSGAEVYPAIPPEGRIPAAGPTNVDALLATGEDVMDNVVTISSSLSKILSRMERGEGLLGELTSESPSGQRIREALVGASESIDEIAARFENGEGVLPRLLSDRAMADRLDRSMERLEGILGKAESGPGLLPGLLNDPAAKARFDDTLANLNGVSADIKRLTGEVEGKNGTLQRLLTDEAYADRITGQLEDTVARLHSVAEKLDRGDGTAGKIVNDPKIYEAINDIIVGVNESRMLRWLLRNRQKSGIRKRYEDARRQEPEAGTATADPSAPPSPAPEPEPPPPAAAPPP
jgi:phospholipid/cholesterol/gamma-HCH transport system substrate-binding protein